MSNAPISAPDADDDERPADALWEEAMIAAAEAAAAGDRATAAQRWQDAFDLADPADNGLAADDPRRAASLAGLGMARLMTGDAAQPETLLSRALAAWDASEAWIARMEPGLRPRSSAQHFRVERRFRAQHAAQALEERRRTLDIGRSATLAALATRHERAGALPAACDLYQCALSLREGAISRRAAGAAALLQRLADVHERRGDAGAAAEFRQRCLGAFADPVLDGVERFRGACPTRRGDTRALLAAVLLLPALL
jgi:hypothetical protein